MIHELKNEGLSISEIARRLGINRKTVRKYLQCERNDVVALKRQPRASKLDSYRAYLCARLREHPQLSARRLLREIRQHGYCGGYSILADYVHTVRPAAEVSPLPGILLPVECDSSALPSSPWDVPKSASSCESASPANQTCR